MPPCLPTGGRGTPGKRTRPPPTRMWDNRRAAVVQFARSDDLRWLSPTIDSCSGAPPCNGHEEGDTMAKVPVFISFDYDHDDDLRVMLVGQAKNPDSPFDVADWSIKEASSDWKDRARARIKRAQQVIVI